MILTIVTQADADGRWLAEVLELPGVLGYGTCRGDASLTVTVLALRVLAEKLEAGEMVQGELDQGIWFSSGDVGSDEN